MLVKDVLGNKPAVGDYISYMVKSNSDIGFGFGFGIVSKITKMGNLKVKALFPKSNEFYIRISKYMIVSKYEIDILKGKLAR